MVTHVIFNILIKSINLSVAQIIMQTPINPSIRKKVLYILYYKLCYKMVCAVEASYYILPYVTNMLKCMGQKGLIKLLLRVVIFGTKLRIQQSFCIAIVQSEKFRII